MTITAPALAERNLQVINAAIQQLSKGRSNAIGTVTLNANATQTVVNAPTCVVNSFVFLSPLTQDAANDGATTWTVPGNGTFTINHANNSRTDRTFGFICLG